MNVLNTTPTTNDGLVALDGQILFDKNDTASMYKLISGEVLILRNGQMVDLVQAGEIMDTRIWNGATAIAWKDCVLQAVEVQQSFPYTHPTVIEKHLRQSVSLVN